MPKTQLTTRGTTMKKLTDKQRAFVYEYTIDYNATRAAKAAGYKNPAAMGTRLLDQKYNPHIARAVGKIQNQNIERATLTREELIEEISILAMRDPLEMCDEEGHFVFDDMRKIPPHIRRSIESFEVSDNFNKYGEFTGQKYKLKLVSKATLLDMLMKHFGMYATQKHEVKHSLDWDSLYNEEEQEVDVIEGKIANAKEPS